MTTIITKNDKETFRLGFSFGNKCHGGEVCVLCGDLGAGKTRFLQGLAHGLGVKSQVNSPTFNIMKVYNSSGKVKRFCHIDAYRLSSEKDLLALGVDEYLDSPDTVTAIEWAEKVKKMWPKKATVINIKQLSENEREIKIS